MKARVICIEGYWNDDPHKRFEHRCLVAPLGLSDDQRDELLELANDDSLFYVFEEGEPIVGKHLDFTVVFYNPIHDINLGESK